MQALRIELELLSLSAECRRGKVLHLDQVSIDRSRPGGVGRVVEQHAGARHPHPAHAVVLGDHEGVAAEALRGCDRQAVQQAAAVLVQRRFGHRMRRSLADAPGHARLRLEQNAESSRVGVDLNCWVFSGDDRVRSLPASPTTSASCASPSSIARRKSGR
jgi:hypothetical protein